jgi:hypothetical protein
LSASLDYLHSWGPDGGEETAHPFQLTTGHFVCMVEKSCNALGKTELKCGHYACPEHEKTDESGFCAICKPVFTCPVCKETDNTVSHFRCYGPCAGRQVCGTCMVDQLRWFCKNCVDAEKRLDVGTPNNSQSFKSLAPQYQQMAMSQQDLQTLREELMRGISQTLR